MKNNGLKEDFSTWIKWNCSTLFLLKPIVGRTLGELYDNFGLIDSYLKDDGKEDAEGEDYLFVLFKPKNLDSLQIFIAIQESENENYYMDYDYEGGYVVVQYSIPELFKHDLKLFKEGRYSKMSPHIKQEHDFKIKTAPSKEEVHSFQYMVFYKDVQLKREIEKYFETTLSIVDELWTIPLMERETLNIQKIKDDEKKCSTESSSEVGGSGQISRRFHSYGCYSDGC